MKVVIKGHTKLLKSIAIILVKKTLNQISYKKNKNENS